MNIAHFMQKAGCTYREHPAIAVGEEVYVRYGELARRVATMAGRFRDRLRLQPGDRVALVMKNCAQFLEVLYAAWHAGLCAVPVNAKLHAREFQYILEHSGSRCCFVTPDLAETIFSIADEVPTLERVIPVEGPDYQALDTGEAILVHECNPDDIAWLFYTSGTTGRPKGAMLSHRNLLSMTLSYFADVDTVSPEDCIIHAAPMSHGSGLYNIPQVVKAAKQVIPASGQFDPGEIFALIAIHRGVTFFAAPTMVKRLVDYAQSHAVDTRHLKTIVYGGGPMYVADLKQALQCFGYKLVQIYGQGESPMTITALSKAQHADTRHPRYEERLASAGIAQTVVEVCVADADDHPLPPGQIGEVLVRGDVVMQGYWNNPAATAETLRGGWLHTGDLGSFDHEGFLTLKDRSKDLIISGGANIYPREVEEVLLLHAAVHEVSVLGRPHPEWGEEVVAFVVKKAGHEVSEEELDALCLNHIARFKRPRAYYFVDHLPKNNYGKILKTELRQWLQQEGNCR
ncbi:MAG: long-chain fatty acid--CoA ligase [Nitrospinota bacterium]|nr:MAG: long-chain fatty acid--CoA ligase [Nitrospinota bacterium]